MTNKTKIAVISRKNCKRKVNRKETTTNEKKENKLIKNKNKVKITEERKINKKALKKINDTKTSQ